MKTKKIIKEKKPAFTILLIGAIICSLLLVVMLKNYFIIEKPQIAYLSEDTSLEAQRHFFWTKYRYGNNFPYINTFLIGAISYIVIVNISIGLSYFLTNKILKSKKIIYKEALNSHKVATIISVIVISRILYFYITYSRTLGITLLSVVLLIALNMLITIWSLKKKQST